MKRSIDRVGLVLSLLSVATVMHVARAQTPAQNRSVQRDAAALLVGPQAPRPLLFASTDRKHQNEDYITLKPGESRRVPLAGGELLRLWSTALEPDKIELKLAGLSAVAGTEQPVVLSGGKARRGTYENKTYLWYPGSVGSDAGKLAAGSALLVRNTSKSPNKWFYQATVRPLTPGTPTGDAAPVSVTVTNTARGDGTLLVSAQGAALVTELRVHLAAKPDSGMLQKIRLLVALQPKQTGATVSLMNVPLGPLVGSFQGTAGPLHDAMTVWDGQSLTLRWPMPFDGARQNMAVELRGASGTLEADIAALSKPNPYRFHAAFGSLQSVKKKPIPILKVTGEGTFAGVRMAISPAPGSARRAFAFLEGNEKLTADGKTYEGTGTEDFFNSAWYFPDQPFARAYGGLTERSAMPPQVSMYRLLIPDNLPYHRGLSFNFEVGRANNSDDLEYRWVAFWYQKESGSAAIDDALSSRASDTAMDALTSPQSKGDANAVRTLPEMPLWAEIVVGCALLGGVFLSLSAVFRRKKG